MSICDLEKWLLPVNNPVVEQKYQCQVLLAQFTAFKQQATAHKSVQNEMKVFWDQSGEIKNMVYR